MFGNGKKPGKSRSVVGLDIGTASVAATEVRGDSGVVARTAIGELPPGAVNDGEVQNGADLTRALKSLFSENKLSKSVRVGVANQRVVVRTLRLPLIENEEELETAIRFQAQDHIPMPLDQAILDHQVLAKHGGPAAEGAERHMDVLAVAARRDMVTSLLNALYEAGLEPVGIDLSAFGMIRALDNGENGNLSEDPQGAIQTTTLYCHLGDNTNLAVARGNACLFTRVVPFGIEPIARGLAERAGISLDEANEWLLDVGLDEPVDEFGDQQELAASTREALGQGATKLIDELRLSLDFYATQEGAPPIERVLLCGPGLAIQGLPERIETGLGLALEARTPPALSNLDIEDAARLTVSYGLALSE
jgi:type IV pilus assembly protein PilM